MSIYKPPEIKFFLQNWNNLFHIFINTGNFDTILIARDLNAQYIAWGLSSNNFAGTTLNVEFFTIPIFHSQ